MQKVHQQRWADAGNEFIHFSIGAIRRAQLARTKGFVVRAVLEHPEDLGSMDKGEPVSIWQFPEVRMAFGDTPFISVAGHQCKFPGVDRKKPFRLFTDILPFKTPHTPPSTPPLQHPPFKKNQNKKKNSSGTRPD